MSCSGGEASVMADAAEGRRVTYRALTAGQASAVKATLGPLVTVANPLDYHTFIWANEPAMTATFAAMVAAGRSEEHTSELQSLMRISYAVFCLKKKTHTSQYHTYNPKTHTTSPVKTQRLQTTYNTNTTTST